MVTKNEAMSQTLTKNPSKCLHCLGYGWNSIGVSIGYFMPISRRDYEQRFKSKRKIIKCPWCSCGDVSTGPMWNALNEEKKKIDKGDIV